MIECVIKPSALGKVKSALAQMGILGVTALECKGFGRQKGHSERYRGTRMDVDFIPKILLKIAVRDEDADQAIKTVMDAARTGNIGDGKLFVYPLSRVYRIRTGDKDDNAL